MKNSIAYLLLASLCVACQNVTPVANQNPSKEISDQKAMINWSGHYEGVLPCASCSGIKTIIILKKDNTFKKLVSYQGNTPFEAEESGNIVWLEADKRMKLGSSLYMFSEGSLHQLDENGDLVKGELANAYVLTKTKGAY